jgi:2-methylaconitate cis-trans-isomerase PrpF
MADIDTSGRESNLEFVTRVFIFEKSHAALCGTASIEIGFYEYGCINLSMNLL